MQVYALRIFVQDLPAALAFYHDVLELPVIWQKEESAFGLNAGISLIVETVPDDAPEEDRALVGRFVGCSFEVQDIHASYDRLCAAGVSFHGAPAQQAWGGTLAHFDDPSGNVLTLVSV
ncbi:MAG: VOC family protein [Pseudomonadota bacterium]